MGEYSGGDGGTLRVSLVAGGKGGLPTSSVLASAEIRPQIRAISFPLVRFGGKAAVTAGRDYDIVFTNTSAKPAENWISVNALVGHGTGAPQPPLAPAGGVFLGDSADGGATPKNWRARAQGSRDNYLPIIEIAGGRTGQHLGLGYMESWISNPKPIASSASVRELFTYKAARAAHVLQAFVRVRRTGAHGGPLSVQLEDPGGKTLAAASIQGPRVPSGSAGWVSATVPKPPVIRDGSKLALVLRSTSGAFEAFPLRKGLAFGFGAVFSGGSAQYSTSQGWTGWDQWGDTNRTDGDLIRAATWTLTRTAPSARRRIVNGSPQKAPPPTTRTSEVQMKRVTGIGGIFSRRRMHLLCRFGTSVISASMSRSGAYRVRLGRLGWQADWRNDRLVCWSGGRRPVCSKQGLVHGQLPR